MSEQKAVPRLTTTPEQISEWKRELISNAFTTHGMPSSHVYIKTEPLIALMDDLVALTSLIERIAIQQERIATLEGMLAENKRVLEIAMGTVARLSAPVSDAEWLDLCAGDALQITDVQRHELDRFIAARTVPPAPQDTENAVSEAQ